MIYKIPIPKMLKIGGYNYSIECDDEADKNLRVDGWTGDYSFTLQRIRVSKYAGKQETANAFIHEVLHAICRIYAANKVEENLIEGIGNGLHQVLEELGITFIIEEV